MSELETTRRDFLRLAGMGAAGATLVTRGGCASGDPERGEDSGEEIGVGGVGDCDV
jgi:hypothetical protein